MVNSEAALDLFDGEAGDLQFAVALPLMADGALAGVMTLYAPERFSDERVRRLEMVAPHLATAIAAADRTRASRPDLRVVSRR
jgi:GAF domain-containing protein